MANNSGDARDQAAAHASRGMALIELGRLDEAVASYDRALELKPDYVEALNNRGSALLALKRFGDALTSYDRALALKPDHARAHYNRGNALLELDRPEEALASYDRALTLKADHAGSHNNRAKALWELKRLSEALASYDKALALNPAHVEACVNRGHLLAELGRLDEALASFERTFLLDPDHEFLLGTLVHTRMKLCAWSGFADSVARLKAAVLSGKKASAPFPLLALIDEPQVHLQAAKAYTQARYPAQSEVHVLRPARRERIRLGYFSGDFCNHPVAHLIVNLLEAHDRATFEVFAFSFGPKPADEMQRRIAAAADTFFDFKDSGDLEIVQTSRHVGIDIAIDLTGHTENARTGIFAQRCAPAQVSHLGYLGSMGADYIDYIVADETVIPPDRQGDFLEKAILMPHSHQINGTARRLSDRMFTRTEMGLPETGFVFCCFNNSYKICPPTFDRWMRILKAVAGSVLWLVGDNLTVCENLRTEAAARGVDPRRLVFASRMPMEQHFARQKLADLFLDTLPYNAGTTTSDALWVGLPVLTCTGTSFASRVAASLLKAAGLPELITTSGEAYEATAVALAKDAPRLAEIKRKLEQNRLTAPLFDAKLFARHIEAAYIAICERNDAGLPPDHIRAG